MARFIVEGGTPLRGEISPAGNKNSALPLIAAALLTEDPVTLRNLPRIRDVEGMLEILVKLGATVEELDPHAVRITTKDVDRTDVDRGLSKEIRTSLLFAGPLVARLGRVTLAPPGGDVIGRRRTDTHFHALTALGGQLEVTPGGYALRAERLAGADILLDEPSVTATENAILCAVRTPGRTVIRNAASEPHVQELSLVLAKMGARIVGMGTNTITIDGAERFRGIDHTLWPDHMEVGSFVGVVAMTHGEARIKGSGPEHLRMTRQVFAKLGVVTEVDGEDLLVPARERYCIQPDLGGGIPKISPQVWPGFPTDLTSIATALATQCEGTVLVHEWMFEARMYFVDSLIAMGARAVLCDPHRAVIVGPSQLYGAELRSPDIRAGLALLAATLCAKGRSVINNIEQIDRGYEDMDGRLRALGARIERTA
ncbi:MAG TPA: UDP-N-acetylglucosamine 1-carboxyvinyltransferase [Candidatus Limnocylindria bacterium]